MKLLFPSHLLRALAPVALLCVLALAPVHAAPRTLPAGKDLTYAATDGTVPRDWVELPALVLDLRASHPAVPTLDELIAARATARRATFVILGEDAPIELRAAAAAARRYAATLVVGPLALRSTVDVAVQVPLETDRAARVALTTTTDLAPLIDERVEKVRFDEASLVESHHNGSSEAVSPPRRPATPDANNPRGADDNDAGAPTAAETDNAGKAPPPPPPLRDPLLQRAIQLHLGLRALGRVP